MTAVSPTRTVAGTAVPEVAVVAPAAAGPADEVATGAAPLRLFALGDSLAEGISDVYSNELLTPFPEYLARSLREGGRDVVTGSAAWRGADADDGASRQCGLALAFRPDLAVVWLGLNDLLRLGFDVDEVGATLRRTAERLTGCGARLLTASMPLPDDVLALPGWSVRRLSSRVAALNDTVAALAEDVGAVHLDVGATLARVGREAMLGPDGIHLTALGHHAVATDYLALLAECGVGTGAALPVPAASGLTRRARAAWFVTRGASYAVRRVTSPR